MTEEKANGVTDQEVAKPVANSEETQVQQTHETQEQVESSKDYNFARLRKKAEDAEVKNAELERQIRELRENFERKNEPVKEPVAPRDPEDFVTYGELEAFKNEQARLELSRRSKSQFSDFDEIMTQENIKKLEMNEPGLAQACANAPNPWEATYKILKKFILPENTVNVEKADMKVKENMSKPASSNSISQQRPLSNANQWSEASQDELYKEMMQAARRA